jgi:deoxyribodipyrimidine photo-lyase
MISAQRVVLDTLARNGARRSVAPAEARESFLEELVVRRELSDNFCLHMQEYDSWNAFPDWAQRTLDKHRNDGRDYVYDLPSLEAGKTHDPLWNAAQSEMRLTGTMHGYLRMYWAKKILEWSASPEDAVRHAIWLNDRYFIDGRDSNGYTGVAWSMGGVHDRPWQERPVFGMVRYMNYAGARRKFDVDHYVFRMGVLERRMREEGAI